MARSCSIECDIRSRSGVWPCVAAGFGPARLLAALDGAADTGEKERNFVKTLKSVMEELKTA